VYEIFFLVVLIARARSSLFKRDNKERDMGTKQFARAFGKIHGKNEPHRASIWSDFGLIILSATAFVSISFGFAPGNRSSGANLLPEGPSSSEHSSVASKSVGGTLEGYTSDVAKAMSDASS
jgi:hypothetical protein